MIKGSLLLSNIVACYIVKHFQAKKKLRSVLGQNLKVLGNKWGFKIKFNFYNPKKAHPCVILKTTRFTTKWKVPSSPNPRGNSLLGRGNPAHDLKWPKMDVREAANYDILS